MYPAGLFVKGIEIHNHDNYVGKIIGRLAKAQKKWVVGFVKSKTAVALQCRIILADSIDPGDQVPKVSLRIQVPVLDFVFLRIQELLAAGLGGGVFAQLESGSVDSIVGSQHARQDQADH